MQGLVVQKYVQLDKLSKGFGKGYELFHGKSFRTDGGRQVALLYRLIYYRFIYAQLSTLGEGMKLPRETLKSSFGTEK